MSDSPEYVVPEQDPLLDAVELARVERALAWLSKHGIKVEFGEEEVYFLDPIDGGGTFIGSDHDGTGLGIRRALVEACEGSPGFDPPPPGSVACDEEWAE